MRAPVRPEIVEDQHLEAPDVGRRVRTKGTRGRPPVDVSNVQTSRLSVIAYRHFVRFGVERASIVAIAEEAGVTRQMIYKRYGDKQKFFDAMITLRTSMFDTYVGEDLELEGRAPEEVLERWANAALNYYLSRERVALARTLMTGLHTYPDLARAEWNAHQRTFALIGKYLSHVAERRGVVLPNPEAQAERFHALVLGIQFPVLLGVTETIPAGQRRRLVREMVGQFLRGIGCAAEA